MKHGKTAVYTILKNEVNYIEKWLSYAQPFDYRVLLDTGSTDGSWEALQEACLQDKNLIIQQQNFVPWRFDVARMYNYSMLPDDVVWCLSPDLDEYFSKNAHDNMELLISDIPDVTNIACDRLDLYSDIVRVGPPHFLPTNKIHLKHGYKWTQPIYEHLIWVGDKPEKEVYADSIYLIHDQDYKKTSRSSLYNKMLVEEFTTNPDNTWCSWFLLVSYYKTKDINNYIPVACSYAARHKVNDKNYKAVISDLKSIYLYNTNITADQKAMIFEVIKTNI